MTDVTKVAVYGSLRKGLHNHGLLQDSDYLGLDKLQGEYTMLDLGSFPGLLLEGSTDITVEVYDIDDTTFQSLDWLEGYPSFYNRTEVETLYGTAWVYYLNDDDYSNTAVPSGDWTDVLDVC